MSAFRAKAPFESMLGAMSVKVIVNSGAGLLGAANFCSHT
jgi:glucokinase